MFDLEKRIREWRRGFCRIGSFEDGYVAELESHLRDEIDRRKARGLNEEEAFESAAALIGRPDAIGAEYHKTNARPLAGPPPGTPAGFSPALLVNYLKVAVRKIKRQKTHSFINVAGLMVGLACCLLLLLWIRDELGYDCFHANAKRIYRVEQAEIWEGRDMRIASTQAPLAPALRAEFPGIENAVRIGENIFDVVRGSACFQEKVLFADPEIFDVFSFPLLKGDAASALREPDSLLLSEDAARKLVGSGDLLGRRLSLKGWKDFRVTGVFKNVPRGSHFHFDFLAPFEAYAKRDMTRWGVYNYYTYLLVDGRFDPAAFDAGQAAFVQKYLGKMIRPGLHFRYVLQPLTRIHLFSHARNEIEANGDLGRLVLFSAVALFILLLACFNYVNFAVASALVRAREVGTRKVVGAAKGQIAGQFLGESFLVSAIAMIAACLLALALLPAFNGLSGKALTAADLLNGRMIVVLAAFLLLTGGLAGSYPALFLSSVRPAVALHGPGLPRLKASAFRDALVVVQFSVSIIFLVATLIIAGQMRYVQTSSLGLDKEQVVCLPLKDENLLRSIDVLKAELGRNPAVAGTSASSFKPGRAALNQNYWKEGMGENEYPSIGWIAADRDFLKTMGIGLASGRDFSEDVPSDAGRAYLLNETAVRELGLTPPLGGQFKIVEKGTVIGVVKDFHFDSFHQKIEPLAICVYPPAFQNLAVRVRPGRTAEVLGFLKNTWTRLAPEAAFEYSFLDEDIDRLYGSDRRLNHVFFAAAAASILVAGLGLYGLAALTAKRRTKEIGIRKALGASVAGLLVRLSREFLRLVIFANFVAWPIAYYAMNRWLESFAYRKAVSPWPFGLAAAFAFSIALLAVGYQTVKAARADPAASLRHE
ncbi:MAG: ABC transporter permease [Acidobacteriota bacterium]